MADADKDLSPEMQRWVRLLRIVAGIIVGAIVAAAPAITAYRTATAEARARAQQVKDKSEAAYQVTKPVVEDQGKQIVDIDARLRRLEAQQHPPARRGSRPRALPAPTPPPAPPKALPNDLDQAQRQVYRPAPIAPVAPPKDASGG